MNFADSLIEKIQKKQSPICLGLDPRLEQIPEFILKKHKSEHGATFTAAAESIIEFNKGILDACADLTPICKPQSAFYEQYGHEGVRALEETIAYAKSKDLLVLLDGKRGDIGSTAKTYSNAYLGKVNLFGKETESFDTDALTVNPYLGSDSITPFLEECKTSDKGIFVLVKTSNPSSGELQDLTIESQTVFEKVAELAQTWGSELTGKSAYSPVGIVVGATYREQAKQLRQQLPHTIFLVPGYGAQGGGAADVLPCFNTDKQGAIINNSRGIIFAYQKSDHSPENYAQAAREATLTMKENIDNALQNAE